MCCYNQCNDFFSCCFQSWMGDGDKRMRRMMEEERVNPHNFCTRAIVGGEEEEFLLNRFLKKSFHQSTEAVVSSQAISMDPFESEANGERREGDCILLQECNPTADLLLDLDLRPKVLTTQAGDVESWK